MRESAVAPNGAVSEGLRGECRDHRAARVAIGTGQELNLHRGQHAHHPIADVSGNDRLDLVIKEEPRNTGVVTCGGALVMEPAPGHLNGVPG